MKRCFCTREGLKTYRQWQQSGRQVMIGEHSIPFTLASGRDTLGFCIHQTMEVHR